MAARAAGSGPNGASFEASFTTSSMPYWAATTSADRPGTYAGMPSSGGANGADHRTTPDATSSSTTAAAPSSGEISDAGSTRSAEAGRLVGVVDAGEARELARARLGVEALRVAAPRNLERRVDEDLDEREAGCVVQRAGRVASGPVRADERDERDDAGVGEEAGHLADPPHVLGAVVGGEPEVAVQSVAQVVAVERVREHAARGEATRATRDAIVDLPEPERPVNHTVRAVDVARRASARRA